MCAFPRVLRWITFVHAVQGFPGMWCAVLVPLPPTQGRGPSMGQTGLGLYIDHSRPLTCLPFSGSPLPGPQRWLCYVCLLVGEKPVPHTKGWYLKKFSVPTGPHPIFGSSLGTGTDEGHSSYRVKNILEVNMMSKLLGGPCGIDLKHSL